MRKNWLCGLFALLALLCAASLALAEEMPDLFASPIAPLEVVTEGGLDNDALFAGYVDALFSAPRSGGPRKAPRSQGSRLTGREAEIYALLREGIAEIAAGERASTELNFPLRDFGPTRWTSEMLGVSIVVDGAINAEALNAVQAYYAYDFNAVHAALMADCPYEMYWFNKASGGGVSHGFTPNVQFSATWDYDAQDYVLIYDSGYYVAYAVAQEYAGEEAYTTDTAVTASASQAAANARALVAQHAGESDYDKLVSYREDICTLTSYNYEAAANNSTPYGNPWQLVWVFDGDDSTNVVCEGYAKAYQYLCDQTDFAQHVVCYTVTGTMSGATGAGGHMWNIVSMPDDANYLVDVTNCDSGSVGADDLLFLKGYADFYEDNWQYNFLCGNTYVLYVYDAKTLGSFTTEELTLSATDYDPDFVDIWAIDAFDTIIVPESTETIQDAAFAGVDAERVILSDAVRVIGANAFANCPRLLYVYIPADVTDIDDTAFTGSDSVCILCIEGSPAAGYALRLGLDCIAYPTAMSLH